MTRPPFYVQFSPTTTATDPSPQWQDISAYALTASTKRGRQKELERDEAGTGSLSLKNDDRRFDPLESSGPYFPGGQSTMVRIRLGGADPTEPDPYLVLSESRGDYAFTPNTGGIGFTGDLDLRADIALNDWTPSSDITVVARVNPSGAVVRDWALSVTSAGEIQLVWSATGTVPFFSATSSALGLSNGTRKWIRATLDRDDGGGNWDAEFFTSTDGSSWSSVSTDTGSPAATISNVATHVMIGSQNSAAIGLNGKVYEVKLVSGIGGTTYANPAFSDAETWWAGDRTGRDFQGYPWVLNERAHIFPGRYYLLSGFCLDWIQSWPNKRNAVARTSIVDAFHVLNLKKLTESFSEEASSTRVTGVLDAAGFSDAERSIADGVSDVIAADIEETPALEHIQHVVDSEGGRFFMSAAGVATFRNRHTQLIAPYTTSLATFGDSGSEYRYENADVIQSESLIYNEANISRIGGDYQSASDATSINQYFGRTYTKSNLMITGDAECLAAAQWIVFIYKDPRTRIEKMVINLLRAPSTAAAVVFALELGDRITIRRRPEAGGDMIEQISLIEGIDHEIGPDRWTATLSLSPAANIQPGIWNDATYGKANQTAIAIY